MFGGRQILESLSPGMFRLKSTLLHLSTQKVHNGSFQKNVPCKDVSLHLTSDKEDMFSVDEF